MGRVTCVLSRDQRAELQNTGITRVAGVVSAADVDAMIDRVWAFFATRDVFRHDRASWPQGLSSKHQGLRQSGVFNRFANQTTASLVDDLLSDGVWSESEAWGPALVTWPQPGPWELSRSAWHFDLPGRGHPDHPPATRLSASSLQSCPTGAAPWSWRAAMSLCAGWWRRAPATSRPVTRSSQAAEQAVPVVRRARRRSRPPSSAIHASGGADRRTGGPADRRTGGPADVTVMTPWTMHTTSMNCSPYPRFMVTQTVMRQDQHFSRARGGITGRSKR
jgi:hypothetical protein